MTHQIRILSEKDVRRALDMPTAIDVMSSAFSSLSSGMYQMPVRMVTNFGKTTLFSKPAASHGDGVVGVKLLTQTPLNRERKPNSKPEQSLPVIQGVIILTDYFDGRFLTMMDGTYITALRTGAASGLATKLLSNHDVKVAAIFGAGAQGRTQLSAICTVRGLEKVYIFDFCQDTVVAYIKEMQPQCCAKLIRGDSLEVLKEVELICTATDSTTPLFSLKDVKEGVHINAIGSYKPSMVEIASDVVAHAALYVDHQESAWAESGVIQKSHVVGELGALINGEIRGRTDASQITLFKSVGVAVQDLAAANAVYRSAVAQNIGVMVEI